MLDISAVHLIILILASFRLTHLMIYDEITAFIRRPFITITYEPDATGRMMQQIHIKGTGLRYKVGYVFSCPWCMGIWSSLVILGLYGFFPVSFFLLLLLAVAGAASILESKL